MMESVMRTFGWEVETLMSSLILVSADRDSGRGPFFGHVVEAFLEKEDRPRYGLVSVPR
jgi:hypothetical protein